MWYGSLVSTCFQHLRHNIYKCGLFDCACQRLPQAVSSLTTFNKTYNFCHTPVTLPRVKCPSIWSPWLFVTCNCLMTLQFFELRGNMSVYYNVNNPRQRVYLKFRIQTSHHYDLHVHVKFPWPDLGRVLPQTAYTLVTIWHHWKKINLYLQTVLY